VRYFRLGLTEARSPFERIRASRRIASYAHCPHPNLAAAWQRRPHPAPFLNAGATPAEYRAGIDRAIAKGWLWRHESGST
jgi:hypothetical protein